MTTLVWFLNKKFYFIIMLLFTASILFAAKKNKVDKEIIKALNKTGKIIICSPRGIIPNTLSLEDAAKKLRSGMILQMHPGYYNPQELIIFRQDKIIIEGVSDGHVNVPIILYGKNCIVRNIRARSIEGESMIAINCVAHSFIITSGKKRGQPILNNCAGNYLTCYPNAQNIIIKNCTFLVSIQVKDEGKVVQSWTYSTHRIGVYSVINFGEMVKKGKILFENCIFYTGGHLFGRSNKLLSLTLENNIIYCERSLARVPAKTKKITRIKNMKDLYTLKFKNNILKKPIFKKTPNTKSNWELSRDNFVLLPASPGFEKGIGVNMGKKGIPVLLETKKR